MEIWLLLTVTGMVSSAVQISVDKEQKTKVIYEGSSVSLYCDLKTDCSQRCRVSWGFNPSGPSSTGCQNLSTKTVSSERLAALTLSNVSQNNSGWYYCISAIEIPILQKKSSNWTELKVENSLSELTSQNGVTKQVPEDSVVWTDWWIWIASGVAGLVLVILVIVCLLLRMRQLRQRDLECPVYANTRPVNSSKQPSPRPRPSDNPLKSDLAYQNLRTPEVGKRYEHSRRLSPRQ